MVLLLPTEWSWFPLLVWILCHGMCRKCTLPQWFIWPAGLILSPTAPIWLMMNGPDPPGWLDSSWPFIAVIASAIFWGHLVQPRAPLAWVCIVGSSLSLLFIVSGSWSQYVH